MSSLARRRRARRGSPAESGRPVVDLAPLIDVVFILLIFFLVTTTFREDAGVTIDRPSAATASPVDRQPLRIAVAASGALYYAGQPIDEVTLGDRLAAYRSRAQEDAVVVLVADGSVPTQRLVEVADVARAAGVRELVIATDEAGGGR